MSLVGHLLWGLPFLEVFGANLRALHLGQALAGAIGILCTFLVARHFLPDRRAAAVSALVAAFPSYALLSTSYMTDTTALLHKWLAWLSAWRRSNGAVRAVAFSWLRRWRSDYSVS
jgi:4-amino-4-deoxy-L-arabinose transferase-like glycosyltransferase